MNDVQLIGVDWGSTNFRAWALGKNGECLAEKTAPIGLKAIDDKSQFETVFIDHCGDWLSSAPQADVLFCGMVGARGGWHEAPYATCPALPQSLAKQAVRFEIAGHSAAILPGVTCRTELNTADVMRGEEVPIFGAAAQLQLTDARFCIPGTHSKWARLKDRQIVGFSTYVTGELFQLLREQSLIGNLASSDQYNESAFHLGIDRGVASALSHALFTARAETLTGKIETDHLSSYLSGVLIGAEIAAEPSDGLALVLLASGQHAKRYAAAFNYCGRTYHSVDADDATRVGLTLAAEAIIPTTQASL